MGVPEKDLYSVRAILQGAMATHLPGLLQAAGAFSAAAIAVASLLGPAQVGARIVEFGLRKRIEPKCGSLLRGYLYEAAAVLLYRDARASTLESFDFRQPDGSLLTRPWREVDSNLRSPVTEAAILSFGEKTRRPLESREP